MEESQTGDVTWRGRVPVSRRFEDPYFSLTNGLAETEHTFIAGNDLPARLTSGFHVAELGVGTGLNLLALAEAASQAQVAPVHYSGFEAYPMAPADLAKALSAFPLLAPLAEILIYTWQPEGFEVTLGPVEATVIVGDARTTLPDWTGQADAWFLDGFAPARNPELWQPDLMAAVAAHTAPGGTFATYTAAGDVRRALAEAGFTVGRVPGYGAKRHMTRGTLTG